MADQPHVGREEFPSRDEIKRAVLILLASGKNLETIHAASKLPLEVLYRIVESVFDEGKPSSTA
jgi:hypothetical protein